MYEGQICAGFNCARNSRTGLFSYEIRTITTVEAEFLDVLGTKVLRIFLLAIQSHLY
jgi:hypothetical protein